MTDRGLPLPFERKVDDSILYEPLHRLVDGLEERLLHDDLFRRAGKSELYRKKWRAAGVRPEKIRGRKDLRSLPFLTGSDLIAMAGSGQSIRKALLVRPRIWITSKGTENPSVKWLPLTLGDVVHWFMRVRRVNELLGTYSRASSPLLVLALNEPMPRASNAVPYLWERVDCLSGVQRLEFIIAAMQMLWRNHWDEFVLKKQPQWLMASVADARSLAHELESSIHKLRPRMQLGLFWGGPLDGPDKARAELTETYGLSDLFSVYYSAECREMYAECPEHRGLHLWMDDAIHELVPEDRGALGQPARPAMSQSQDAIFVDQASPGTEGEYVFTSFGEALPLIRYRTGDRIRVVDTAPCACGITHPRVQFLGRQT